MGDKGEILKPLNVGLHYDDQMDNLLSVEKAGIIPVEVVSGYGQHFKYVPFNLANSKN